MAGNYFGNLLGGAPHGVGIAASAASALQNSYGPYQQGLANNPYHAQQALARQYAAAQAQSTPQWMIDGKVMTIEAFANEVYGEDTPEKTFFLLKYTKETK